MATAVVIGAGIAGLLAARVLADEFEKVLIVEKDNFPTHPSQVRKGLPQAHHQHILLLRGKQIFERLFPGFDAALEKMGAPLIDYSQQCELYVPQGKLPKFPSELKIRPCRRAWIDWVLRDQLQAFPQVEWLSKTHVANPVFCSRNERVLGVVTDTGKKLAADLVVDTAGKGSRLTKQLSSAGYEEPPKIELDPRLGYASQLFQFSEDAPASCIEVAPHAPDCPRACGFWQIDEQHSLLTLIGVDGHFPAKAKPGFDQFAQKLMTPAVSQWMQQGKAVSDIQVFRGSKNRWYQYHKLKKVPAGLIVMGDAFCAFNPFHGQGMTVAALTAEVLQQYLQKGKRKHFSASWCRSFYKKAARQFYLPWLIALSEDLRWPSVNAQYNRWWQRLLLNVSYQYMDRLLNLCQKDEALTKHCLSVANMVRSPWVLARPDILIRVAQTGKVNQWEESNVDLYRT